jgi:hypothetical protein
LQFVKKITAMKCLILAFLISTQLCLAQIDLPDLSPEGMIKQRVGYTDFTIHYGRPAARERKIMGGLVPFDRLWRTGGGRLSTIAFDRDVTINGKDIAAGTYALVTIPGEKEWTVMLNSDTSRLYGDPSEYDLKTEVIRLRVASKPTDRHYESFTIDVDIIKYDAVIYLAWEKTQIHFPIETGSHKLALNRIQTSVKGSPDDHARLAEAAYYYTMNNENPAQALKWLDHAIESGGDRWVYHQKVDLLEKLNRYSEARRAATAAMAFLRKRKPVEWEAEVSTLEQKMKSWPPE